MFSHIYNENCYFRQSLVFFFKRSHHKINHIPTKRFCKLENDLNFFGISCGLEIWCTPTPEFSKWKNIFGQISIIEELIHQDILSSSLMTTCLINKKPSIIKQAVKIVLPFSLSEIPGEVGSRRTRSGPWPGPWSGFWPGPRSWSGPRPRPWRWPWPWPAVRPPICRDSITIIWPTLRPIFGRESQRLTLCLSNWICLWWSLLLLLFVLHVKTTAFGSP